MFQSMKKEVCIGKGDALFQQPYATVLSIRWYARNHGNSGIWGTLQVEPVEAMEQVEPEKFYCLLI